MSQVSNELPHFLSERKIRHGAEITLHSSEPAAVGVISGKSLAYDSFAWHC